MDNEEELQDLEQEFNKNFGVETRPLDMLNALRGKTVTVDLRSGETVTGKLLSFDLTINLGLEIEGNVEFVKGESVVAIYQLA